MVKVEFLKHLFLTSYSVGFLGELSRLRPTNHDKSERAICLLTLKILIILTRQSKRKR
ncbi:hypothetical protein HMPREF1425_00563 [Helicobacter pylori GAM71Ai]|nr:hypothetical protein HMPREF1425_00563 [Helicobacter pylori GAM71Ai]EMJ42847.1 hypothetical protein HMPREF1434_01376 [Helicobacter pylori GAMchJs124i]